MTKLVHSIDKVIPHLYIGGDYRDIVISGRIYQKSRTFLGIDLSPKYYYTLNIPFIKDPFYDGEYSTNRVLNSFAQIMQQELKDKIQEFKEFDNKRL